MRLPSFTGEASLYKTDWSFRGYSGAAGVAAQAIVPSQLCGWGCYALCGVSAVGCGAACLFSTGPALVACIAAACGLAAASCVAECPPTCPECDTCTNCHSTEIGWCFCSGQNCGWNSPCCAPAGAGGGDHGPGCPPGKIPCPWGDRGGYICARPPCPRP